MKITISVTPLDIVAGLKQDEDRCPVALAAKRALNVFFDAGLWVVNQAIEFGGAEMELPLEAQDFITRFDFGEQVDPFEFEIDVPEDLIPEVAR